MKKRFLLFGLIFAVMAFTSRAQIYEMYSQNFETGTPVTYTVSGAAATQTNIVSGGQRAMKLTPSQTDTVRMVLDTIDFSANATLNYFTLEFQHIAFANATGSINRVSVCNIVAKLPGQSSWTTLGSSQYNTRGEYSVEFLSTSSFYQQSYPDWEGVNSPNNTLWKPERFDLEQLFQGVPAQDRKLIIAFEVNRRNRSAGQEGWFIDDIRVRASSQQIVTPAIQMVAYPDHLNYPSSRGAKVVADVTTTVSQGINGDSVYAVYRVGNSNVEHRAYLSRVPGTNRFTGRIPFYGYDTLMHYHIVAKDSTNNHNTVYFPKNSSQWLTYKCVRGKTNSQRYIGTTTNNSAFPFIGYADNRSEFIYDSAMMAELGFGPGAINKFTFTITAAPVDIHRPHLQFRMANAPTSQLRTNTMTTFTKNMQIVYDSAFTIERASANSTKTINLQDTFFYAGSDLIVQVFYDGTQDPAATSVHHIPTAANKVSLFLAGHEAAMNYNAFSDPAFDLGDPATTRPLMQFFETENVPLVYDCGVSSLAYPSFDVPCNIGTDSVVVWLKNYGVHPMNAVRITYRIDNRAPVSYDWTGTLNGGDSIRVLVNPAESFTVGYHTMRAWVEDTMTCDSLRVRDHEPYNDTCFSPFSSCDGPYSGVRTVGTGSSANFSSLENCLYVLSRCGIDGPLTIKLPAGVYGVTKFPYIPGTSATNQVTFEPATATAQVTFRRPRGGSGAVNVPALVDMSEARGIRFNNIRFSNGMYSDNRCDVLVQLGPNSAHSQFENCTFVDSNTVTNSAQALLHTGEADSVLVTNCSFYGGIIGADVRGLAPDNRAWHNIVQFCNFTKQVNTAISIINQSDVLIDSNFVNDVLTNASYIILGQYVYDGSRIVRNRVFSSTGSSCIGVSDMHGSSNNYCIIANNMLVSLDDGTSNMLTTPLNVIQGSYIKAVFNSVRMNAPTRVNVAAATFGGGLLSNSYFQNNVVATFDTVNYAFSFIPGNNAATLHVDHNCYYSVSGVLNKLGGSTNYSNLNQWRAAVPGDVGSVVGNPNYTNGSVCRVDLRSFNALLRNVGTPVPEVTVDLFGSTRNATAPSLGAYEVTALSIDFTPVEFVTPYEDYCGAPSNIPVEVAIRNTGNGTYTYSTSHPITVSYSIDNGPVQSFQVTRGCGPNDTLHFLSTRTMSLPSGPNNTDKTYTIRWWVKCNLDPDDLNDTNTYTVLSRYAAPAPTVINMNVAYNTAATITPTAGVNTWPVSYYTNSGNGRQQRSGISWYHEIDDTAKFFYGPTLVTDPLFDDTTFYISQKRNLPLVKITEVQVNRTATGATNPQPSYMNTSTNFAVELTNCGDYPADLEGDSIIVVQASGQPKIWVLPRVTIEPGANLLLQFKAMTTPSDSTRTIFSPSTAVVAPAYTTTFGVIYRDGHGIADAVPFNTGITTSTNWTSQNVPMAVWSGTPINLSQGGCLVTPPVNTPTAGARRISWPTAAATANPTSSPSANQWQVATADHPMHLGETETNLIRYYDNGCEGLRSAVNVHVTNVPNNDLAVDEPVVDTGCNLTATEPVLVNVHNYGAQTVSSVTVKYSLNNGATVACSDVLPVALGPRSSYLHTFSVPINMHQAKDSVFNVKVWVDAITTDALHTNDTNSGSFLSRFTPDVPVVTTPRSVNYGDTLHLTAGGLAGKAHAAWYDASHNPLDTTTGMFATPYIYHPDTFFVKAIALVDVPSTHVGTLATLCNNNYPSPYNPKMRYVKEQYLFTADEILAAGHEAGTITSLSFFLESLGANVSSFTYSYYTIKMGTTTLSTFANGNFISTGLNQVYNANNLTLDASNIGWVHHKLNTPFVWNGTSNIIIEITRALNAAGPTTGANTRYTAKPNTVITKQNASTDQASQASGTKGNNRPDITFGFNEPQGCESAETAILVNVVGVPNVDASIEWPASLDTTVIASCDTTHLDVVLKNMGNNPIGNYTLRYKIDNNSWQQTTGNANNLGLGYNRTVPLLDTHLTPGRHTIRAVVNVSGDAVNTNDTITRSFNVRFCTGTYTIGSCTGHDYTSLTTAIDTLHNAGVAGPVVFELCPQTFTGQIELNNIPGADANNTITFKTVPGSSSMAKIMANTSSTANRTLYLHNTNYVTFDSVYVYANYTSGSGNNIYANTVFIEGSSNVAFRNCVLRSKKTTASSTNANVVLLGSENHYVTIDHCVIDSGYFGVRSYMNIHSDNINITNNEITNFWYQGVNLRACDTVKVLGDSIVSGVTVAGKPLTGIYISDANHASVQKNFIFLVDDKTGGKRGIQLNHCRGTNIDRVTVYNNMISLSGSAVASLSSSGIWIDSLSKHVNVLFNTANLYAGANQAATRVFSVQNSSNIHALNNIFKNDSKGYAAYIAIDTCMASSNFNVYWTNAETAANGTRKFVKWGTPDCQTIDTLRMVNGKDINSLEERPYFVAPPYNLRLSLAQFAGKAQYNPDVTTDVYDSIRPQIPAPTIGAHEFGRLNHNLTVAEIITPIMPTVTTGNNPEVYNIESDSIPVRVSFYNNGDGPENNVTWHAYLKDANPPVVSVTRTLSRFPARTMIVDSVMLPSPLGVVDTQNVIVVINTDPNVVDALPEDNYDTAQFFIYPAYNLQLVSVSVLDTVDTILHPLHCRMYSMPIKYTIKNAGFKDFPATFQFNLGYDYYCSNPSTASFPNFPGFSNEDVTNFTRDLPVGTTEEVINHAAYWPNLYPTGSLSDITVKFRGFVNYAYDVKPMNDTTNYINVTSNHTPEPPVGHDTMVNYGAYGNLYSTQSENRVIRWYLPEDTISPVSDAFFYNGNNNYSRSTHWSSTPQFFHDTVFYMNAKSSKNCPSYYSPINVGINPPLYCDVSISQVRSPRASGRVYLENDTVTLRVVNYGAAPVSNIPIAFKFMNANGRTTYLECHDTVRATIPGRVGDNVHYFDFTFDTALLQINQPLTNVNYTLNAWVYHPDDQERGNDTLRSVHNFCSLAESTYATKNETGKEPTAPEGFDITRVSFYTLDNVMPDMIGYTNLFVGNYNENLADVPHLVVRRGTTDTLTVEVANNQIEMDSSSKACLMVAIDYNRDGVYDSSSVENLTLDSVRTNAGMQMRYARIVESRREVKIPLTIPDAAHYGFMRMLVWVEAGDTNTLRNQGLSSGDHVNGQMQQYLLYVTEDKWLDSVNAALTRVVTPRNHIVTDTDHTISVMLANTGRTPLTSATINYHLFNPAHVQNGTINWSGNLEPGKSEVVMLDSVFFLEGTTNFTASVTLPSDTADANRPVLQYQYHRWYLVEPRFIDSFDEEVFKWYIPAGYNAYTRNYFNRDIPAKSHISSAYSSPYALVTNGGATETIVTGKYGNRSVVYTPKIYIGQVTADTLAFLMARHLLNGSHLRIEYLDWLGNWVSLDNPLSRPGADDGLSWYDDEEGWNDRNTSGVYNTYQLPTSLVRGNFQQVIQFRFVYTTPVGTSNSASFGEGVAIDNWNLGRARRDIDLGVTDIVYPTEPQFGQSIKPRVRIHNYGLDTITDFIVGYTPYGTYLAHESICPLPVPPDEDIEYEFPDPFIITNTFPDTFQIYAYTRATGDIYTDNDTVFKDFGLSPLANDLYMYEIMMPRDNCTAGDSLYFTVRLRNFGQNDIEQCDVHLIFNDGDTVTEHINFADYLGRPLGSTEFFNYTFQRRYRATFGVMNMQTWCSYEQDVYPYNDTLSKRITGIANIIDMKASGVFMDTRNHEWVHGCVVLENVGSFACNDFTVVYWYDNDLSTLVEETFHSTHGIASGERTVFRFSTDVVAARGEARPFDMMTAYVVVNGDENSSNDTTSDVLPYYSDLSVDKVQVEENMSDSCRVRVQITNLGTIPYDNYNTIKVTINGGERMKREIVPGEFPIAPGETRYMMLSKDGRDLLIPKSPTRTYVGSATMSQPNPDENAANDQTSIVEVINYFESVPLADDDNFALEQNYPNPYDDVTDIEFAIPYGGNVRFFVSDIIGRQVFESNATYAEGRHIITFEKGELPAGVYYYGIEFGGERRMNKMIIK